MGQKKRKRNLTVYGSYEGDRDGILGFALKNNNRDKVFAWFDEDFEPDHPLSQEIKEELARCWRVPKNDIDSFLNCRLRDMQSIYNSEKRKPILIISQPVCVESLILRALNHKLPVAEYIYSKRREQINLLKDRLDKLIGTHDVDRFYKEHLTSSSLEERRKNIPELDLLLSMIKK